MPLAERILDSFARWFLFLLALLLLAGSAPAAPPNEEQVPPPGGDRDELYQAVVETRRSAMERYRVVREERRKALAEAAVRATGSNDQVPGWDLESPKPAEAAPEQEEEKSGAWIVWLAGAGVILSLAARIRLPYLYQKRRRGPPSGEPMTIKLRPRSDRGYGRAS